jgi:glucose-1-phosphate thymidylyltransferase
MKGIILAGGKGTRLFPATLSISKQMLPIYDKPLIYYPLSTLMLGGIQDILIITNPESQNLFENLLKDGSQWGINIQYKVQDSPRGLADAFLLGEDYIANQACALILGDNIFYGDSLSKKIEEATNLKKGAHTFASYVRDPHRYGICEFDANDKPIRLTEKPKNPLSNWAVTGLYFYDNQVVDYAKSLKPSARGELEITDLNNIYFNEGLLNVEKLGRGVAWFDTGTPESMLSAGEFVRTIETNQRFKIACLEEIALRKKFISRDQYSRFIDFYRGSDYGSYLEMILPEIRA